MDFGEFRKGSRQYYNRVKTIFKGVTLNPKP